MKQLLTVLALAVGFTFFLSFLAFSETASSDSLSVKKVENLPDDFIFGMDASSVIALEQSGVRYYDFDGSEEDVFRILADNGITHIRVRIWNHPYDSKGRGYGGGNCDIDKAVAIGKRATACGMKLIVNFHYSDFWADPGKQMVPLAWKNMEIEEKTEAVYAFTKECLEKLTESGVDIGMVQVGNETNNYLCGEKIWFNIQYLLQAGARAAREVCPDALVALHFANPEKADSYATYAKKMAYYDVDYDVFASSYYPYWHGSLENLSRVLSEIAETYGKKVMVMETSYAYTGGDTDFFGNTIGDGSAVSKPYPYTIQGQANSIRDITETIANKTVSGIGVVYWEGTWISVGGSSWEENHELWETYGSGWATSYAFPYDPYDAGKYYGGCAVDNQALFDENGKALESLKVFKLMKSGNELEKAPDAIEDIYIICDLNQDPAFPDSVNAVMNDGTKSEIPVVWNISDEMITAMRSGGVNDYEITGTAGGMTAKAYVSMVEYNYLTDYSFEDGGVGWTITDLKNADELYIEDKKSDSLTGSKHMHFWSAKKNSVEFTLEQEVTSLPSGNYKYTVSIMGGDCGNTEIYSYVKINGRMIRCESMKITSYGNWDTAVIDNIAYDGESGLIVGVYVKCEGSGNGAWGKIDDALLNSVPE